MTQCTYKHLYDGLRVFLWDPPATLVRGFVRRYPSGTYAARFQPFYNGESEGLPKSGTGGQLAFVVRDGNGSVLARYPFTPVFETGDGPARSFMAFAQPIPALSAAARSIELVAPNGVIARKALVGPAPQVTIERPQAQPAGAVRFSWTSDPGTVFTAYLSGGGALRRLFSESTQHAVTVSLAPRARYTFELIASNGSRSTQVSRTVAGGGT
jgi:hypothetical protein